MERLWIESRENYWSDEVRWHSIILVILWMSCTADAPKPSPQQGFSPELWSAQDNGRYVYRRDIYESVLYSDTLRTLIESELIQLLGTPDRSQDGHHYYTVDERSIGLWTVYQKSIVIKINAADSVEWIKLHE